MAVVLEEAKKREMGEFEKVGKDIRKNRWAKEKKLWGKKDQGDKDRKRKWEKREIETVVLEAK